MGRRQIGRLAALLMAGSMAVGCAAESDGITELGDFEELGKTDAVEVEVPFEVGPGDEVRFELRTVGRLHVDARQDGTSERLQLSASTDGYRRRSWRGRSPFLRIRGTQTASVFAEYELTLINWGDEPARGTLRITTDEPGEPGVTFVTNTPDCDGCEDPAGSLRTATLSAIQDARASIDLSVYGIDDPAIVEALCEAAEAGVRVRVVSDAAEADELGERYHQALLGLDGGLVGCGIPVELIGTSGIMHNKYYLIDAGTDAPVLVTGSTNQTTADFEVNHNHQLVVRGSNELLEAYVREFEQLFNHCIENDGCSECTPSCTMDVSEEGPFEVGESTVQVFFSPSDDAMVALRGETRTERVQDWDPDCGPGADCACVPSGASGYRCEYCAQGDDGYGLLDTAEDRIAVSVYSATDTCFALGVARAHERGVSTLVLFDKVKAGSPYSVDERVCVLGVPSLVSQWNGGSAQARNHHKLVVVDDVVMTGSMNLSASGAARNHENTLFVQDQALADEAAGFVRDEATLLEGMGATASCL